MKYGHDALKRYKELTGRNEVEYSRYIIVRDSDEELIVEGTYGIIITLDFRDSDFSKIDILWEDYSLPDYQSKGLFGRFTAKYNEIELNLDELVITDSNDNTYHLSL